jgi:hypothetical protein
MQITAVRTLTQALTAPGLSSAVSGSTATLTWAPPTPTGQSVIAGYRVYKSATLGGAYTQIGSALPPTQLSLADTLSGTQFYKIEAFDQFVTGARSGGVQCAPVVTGATRIHPGHRLWLDNPFYPGNQQGLISSACGTIAANQFNGIGIIMTWANISDAALNSSGRQTFGIFQTNLQDVLNRVKATTSKKIYITLKFWQGAFYSTHSGNTTSVSGNTITDSAGLGSGGWTQCSIGGATYTVTSSTTTTATLAGYSGGGGSYLLGAARANDGSMWPAWLINKGNWVKTFFQTNTNSRGQLNYDIAGVFPALIEMFQGMANVISALDTDNRIDIIAIADESISATVDIHGNGVMNGSNYDAGFVTLGQAVKTAMPNRTLWMPLSYTAVGGAPSMQSSFTQMQSSSSGVGYGGPDTPTFGVHGAVSKWYTTFLDVITGVEGTLGDVRDSCLRIGNTEGPGGLTSSSPNTLQKTFNDIMTRQAIPANGSIPAHQGLGCSVMHWDLQTRFFYKTSDIVSVVNANSGFFTPLPSGNWDTSP